MIILTALWIAWCALHSLLISRTAHNLAGRFLGPRFPLYRLWYVFFSVVTLVPVLWYQFSLPHQVLVSSSRPLIGLQAILLIYSVFMFYAGARVYDMSYFIGLKQLRGLSRKEGPDALPFHTGGILEYVRHPWYSGGIAFLWGTGSVTDVFIVSRAVLTVYIITGTLLEESRLKKELGAPYIEYCKRVPMLLPWKKRPG